MLHRKVANDGIPVVDLSFDRFHCPGQGSLKKCRHHHQVGFLLFLLTPIAFYHHLVVVYHRSETPAIGDLAVQYYTGEYHQ